FLERPSEEPSRATFFDHRKEDTLAARSGSSCRKARPSRFSRARGLDAVRQDLLARALAADPLHRLGMVSEYRYVLATCEFGQVGRLQGESVRRADGSQERNGMALQHPGLSLGDLVHLAGVGEFLQLTPVEQDGHSGREPRLPQEPLHYLDSFRGGDPTV